MAWSYIYALTCPFTREVKYIGQSQAPSNRHRQHLVYPGNQRLRLWITELRAANLRPGLRIIERCHPERAYELERFWIEHYLGIGVDLKNFSYVATSSERSITKVFWKTSERMFDVAEAASMSGKTQRQVRSLAASHIDEDGMIGRKLFQKWQFTESDIERLRRIEAAPCK